jgi:hypothetical protein
MDTIRWILAGFGLIFFLLCFAATIATAVRWFGSGKTGTGLPVVRSVVEAAGIMAAPMGTLGQRLVIALFPFTAELATYLVIMAIERSKRKTTNRT